MARRKDRRRRPHATPQRPAAATPPDELLPAEERGEAAPERLGAPGGTAGMAAVVATSAVVAGVLLSGWTPGSVEPAAGGNLPRASSSTPATTPTPPAQVGGLASTPAKNIFGAYCGICHTLAADGATGIAGPDLDQLRPTAAQVLRAIRVGGRGTGEMPPGILHGRTAARVAAYVASVAGR
jgi:mono/diheme cytochrome c family protein